MTRKNKLIYLAVSALTYVTSVAAHEGAGGSLGGFCGHGSFCHGIADSFGHGLLGTGWIGFLVVSSIWIVGMYTIIQKAVEEWAEKSEE